MPSHDSPDDIRQRMDALRHSLDADVQQVAASVRTKTDWRHFVRNYTWLTVGAATVVGYLLVPRRAQQIERVDPKVDALSQESKNEKSVENTGNQAGAGAGRSVLMKNVSALALAVGTRAAASYLSGKLSGLADADDASEDHDRSSGDSRPTPVPK